MLKQLFLLAIIVWTQSIFILGQQQKIVEIGKDKIILTRLETFSLGKNYEKTGRRLLVENNSQHHSVIGVKGGIQIWNLHTGDSHICYGNKKETYERLSLSRNAEVIAGYKDGGILIWKGDKCEVLLNVKAEVNKNIYLSPDGKYLFYSEDETNNLWDISNNKLKANLNPDNHITYPNGSYSSDIQASLTTADFSPDGKVLAIAYYYDIYLWDVESGAVIQRFIDQTIKSKHQFSQNGIYRLKFSNDGKLLASNGYDGFVKIWNVSSGKLIKSLSINDKVWGRTAFSEDNKYLATAGSKGEVTLWNISSGQLVWKINQNNRIPLFSSSEIGLISVESGDIYDVETGRKIDGIKGEFLDSGNLIMNDADGKISYWNLKRK